jgi:hypothetical protein
MVFRTKVLAFGTILIWGSSTMFPPFRLFWKKKKLAGAL